MILIAKDLRYRRMGLNNVRVLFSSPLQKLFNNIYVHLAPKGSEACSALQYVRVPGNH